MTNRIRIKMCGVTRLADAQVAIEAGVDALGFIFHKKSPRNIDPDSAVEILNQLPPFVSSVGVFVDKEKSEVEDIIRFCRLSHVQLHGSESPKYCERLARQASPCRLVKAFRVNTSLKKENVSIYDSCVQGYLLDSFKQGVAGGTGKVFDWSAIEQLQLQKPLILAGGLDRDNIGEALAKAMPFAVDVNSGVEVEPGIKDARRIREFVQEVRKAEQNNSL